MLISMKLVLLWSLMNWGNWSLSKFDRPQKLIIIFWGNDDFYKDSLVLLELLFSHSLVTNMSAILVQRLLTKLLSYAKLISLTSSWMNFIKIRSDFLNFHKQTRTLKLWPLLYGWNVKCLDDKRFHMLICHWFCLST